MHRLQEALNFLEELGWENNKFVFQTFDDNSSRKDRNLTRVFYGPIENIFNELVAINKKGGGIYVCVNRTDLKGRKKENIVAARAFFLDDDGCAIEPPLVPNIVVKTSKNKRHLYYTISEKDLPLREYETALKQFVKQYKGDKNASDICRVMRLPGFYNMKDPKNPYYVEAEIHDFLPKSSSAILEIINIEPSVQACDIKKTPGPSVKEHDLKVVQSALEYVSSNDRKTWIDFGIALKNDFSDDGFEIWNKWSQKSSKYIKGECKEKWKDFRDDGDIHIASIIFEAQKHGFDTSLMPKALPPEEDFDDWQDTTENSVLKLFNASNFRGKDVPEQDFVIDNLLISGAPISLYGDPGIGKSTLALQMCAAIALGQDFLGFQTNMSKCLMLSCEDELNEIHRRLDRMCRAYEWRYEDFKNNLAFCCRAGEDNLFIEYAMQRQTATKTNFFHALIETIKDENFEFLVIDNIANVFGGNENDRSETTRFMTAIYELCRSADISVMLLGHPPKGQGSYSGSTAWEATVRQRFNLKKDDKNTYVLKCEKANYIRVGEEIEMSKNTDGVFVESFSLDAEKDNFDFAGLKAQIWNFVKDCNDNSTSISFAHQAGADYYEKRLRYKGLTKGYRMKDIHRAVEELAREGRLVKKDGTSKMIAVECV